MAIISMAVKRLEFGVMQERLGCSIAGVGCQTDLGTIHARNSARPILVHSRTKGQKARCAHFACMQVEDFMRRMLVFVVRESCQGHGRSCDHPTQSSSNSSIVQQLPSLNVHLTISAAQYPNRSSCQSLVFLPVHPMSNKPSFRGTPWTSSLVLQYQERPRSWQSNVTDSGVLIRYGAHGDVQPASKQRGRLASQP